MAVYSPGVTSHQGAPRDGLPTDSGSRQWHDTFDHQSESGVLAESSLNASVEIWQLADFGERGLEVGWASG